VPPASTEAPSEPETEQQAEPEAAEESVAEPESAVEEAPVSDVRTFVIVPEQSRASYIVAEEFFAGALDRLGIQPGLTDTIGSTQEVTGEMQLDFGNLADPVVSGQFAVNIESLTSDQPRRDNRIREANLESSRYPLAEFTITGLENAPTAYAEGEEVTFQALGDITIREITVPATFDVTATLDGGIITGVATTQLAMSDFGFDPPNFANMFTVANEFTAQVEFTFQQQ
jgi:polyisoprenoid-binding protein YceI